MSGAVQKFVGRSDKIHTCTFPLLRLRERERQRRSKVMDESDMNGGSHHFLPSTSHITSVNKTHSVRISDIYVLCT